MPLRSKKIHVSAEVDSYIGFHKAMPPFLYNSSLLCHHVAVGIHTERDSNVHTHTHTCMYLTSVSHSHVLQPVLEVLLYLEGLVFPTVHPFLLQDIKLLVFIAPFRSLLLCLSHIPFFFQMPKRKRLMQRGVCQANEDGRWRQDCWNKGRHFSGWFSFPTRFPSRYD